MRYLLPLTLLAIPALSNAQSFTENFDDVTTLTGSGWASVNRSDSPSTLGPLGSHYFQGNDTAAGVNTSGNFAAYNGTTDQFISSSFGATTGTVGTETISDWLFTPTRTITNGDTLSFYTRTTMFGTATYPDRLELRLSTNGSSTNVGATSATVGDFSTLLLSVNPNLTTSGYPLTWTQFTATISGLGAPVSGRFAFRYFDTSAGANGNNSGKIGIDNAVYTQFNAVPEPATMAALGLGVIALAKRRRKQA